MPPLDNARIVFGEEAADGLGRHYDSYLAVSMDVPWGITRQVLGKLPQQVYLVESVDFDAVDELAKSAPPVEAVFGIGGGQAIDVAKYVAWKRGMKLVLIPTIVSTNAFATATAGLRKKGKVEYLGDAQVDRLVIDYNLIKTAPKGLNISGVGDILSCHTASFDWKLASEHHQEPLGYDENTAKRSAALVDKIDANFQDIRDVTNKGIRVLVECELEIVEICIGSGSPGHFRSEEGSEHFFFYNVEHRTGHGFIHGWIVGLGIFLMSRLQDNRPAWITDLLNRLELPYQPHDLKLTREDVVGALLTLRDRTHADQRWWSVIDEREIGPDFIESALEGLRFC